MEYIDLKLEKAQELAKAFYDLVLEGARKRLAGVWGEISRNGLLDKLDNPDVAMSEKRAALDKLLGDEASVEERKLLLYLAQNNRVHYLPDIIEELGRLMAGGAAKQLVVITTAVELTDEEKSAIEKRLIARYGPDLDFKYRVDPEILGGVRIRIGDKVIDASVAGRLEALRERLLQRV